MTDRVRPFRPFRPRAVLPGALLLLALAWGAPAGAAGPAPAGDAALAASLERLVQGGGVIVGEAGGVVLAYERGRYIPASIVKLATALTALEELGPDFRFRTEFYLDAGRTLYVRGYGDPFLVSEEWALIAAELAAAGAFGQPLAGLVLDTSALADDLEVDGASESLNPYDARLGALVSNFNTVFVRVAPGGEVVSAEPQTPLTPLARELAADLEPGEHRINLSVEPGHALRHTGELALAILGQAGARFAGGWRTGRVPGGLAPLLTHRNSRPLTEVVRGMLEYSNNFIANQVVLALGLRATGEPATLAAGVARVERFLTGRLGLADRDVRLAEGSGLSRRNRITLAGMLRVVDAFYPWRGLMRVYGKPPFEARAKSGTLNGVHTMAGFLPGPQGARRGFVIMLNQPRNNRHWVFRALVRAFGEPAEGPGADAWPAAHAQPPEGHPAATPVQTSALTGR